MGKIVKFLAKQKFRFDSGQTLLGIVNFMLLLVAVSDKFGNFFGIGERWIIIIGVPMGMLSVWFLGYIILAIGWRREIIREGMQHNPMILETWKIVKKWDKKR